MFKVRYSYIDHDERGRRWVAHGVLWIDAPDAHEARRLARATLRATTDGPIIKSVHNTSIGG